MRPLVVALLVLATGVIPGAAAAQVRHFPAGSLILPMDLDYQDHGMLSAYGLLYQLLLADVTVYWAIDPDKSFGDADFVASAVDVQTEAVIDEHGYRAGPFVVDASQAALALPIVDAWHAVRVTAVHRVTESFEAPISRTLTAAPTIAVFADGNEDIAFGYLNAAGIPDSLGQRWPGSKQSPCTYGGYPDILCIPEIRGPTDTNHADGALFGPDGLPVYCQIMTMHWGVNDRDEEVIAEMRSFLAFPTHLMAECQAVNAIENAVNGRFLTPNGYLIGSRPSAVDVISAHLPFGQFDGRFATVGGSEPSYSLPPGDAYYDDGVVMLTAAGTPIGTRDVWMTGYVGGACLIDPKEEEPDCTAANLVGKVSYLGGHRYSTNTPISRNADTQGTRLFLNSLFEADCATPLGQPASSVTLAGPRWTPEPRLSVSATVRNESRGLGHRAVLTLALPPGASFVSAHPAADTIGDDDGLIAWDFGTLGPLSERTFTVTFDLPGFGTYRTDARLDYVVGVNARLVTADPLTTVHSLEDPHQSDDVGPTDDVGEGGGGDAGGDTGDAGSDAGNGDAGTDPTDPDTDGHDGPSDGASDGAMSTDGGGGRPGGAPGEEGCDCAAGRGGWAGAPWPAFLAVWFIVRSVRRRRGRSL
jgi:hypothetical protein